MLQSPTRRHRVRNTSISETPMCFSVQKDDGVWSAQLTRCDVEHLLKQLEEFSGRRSIQPTASFELDDDFPPVVQYVERTHDVTEIVDLLLCPKAAFKQTGGSIGFVQTDATHAVVYAIHLADMYAIWKAWIRSNIPETLHEIDPHQSEWATCASLLWPHPLGQWSEIRTMDTKSITAFDIIDIHRDPSGHLNEKTRTRLLKTSDNSWRTGWMW